ncbi:MAG TPA: TolC family protein, partial [Candidatus Deferrimicrobiaceae bacterium]|nr:TolC family protein [Candidatus Deferrimicrobiaceae bacterium]
LSTWRSPCHAGPDPGVTVPAGDNVAWDLDQVVRIAVARHPQVSQADAETQAAAARKGQAQSPYYPAIDLETGYSYFKGFSSSSGRSFSTETISAQGRLSQIITDFGRTGAAVRRSDALLSSARETGKSVREDVAFAVKVAYYNVLRAQRILTVNQETVRQRDSLLRQARAFYDAGIRARIDVARAEANLYQARAQLTGAENDLRVARITLLNRMGIDGPRSFELKDTLAAESIPGTLEEWVREAESGRPDLKALVEQERAAGLALRAARAGNYPVLTGNGEYGYAAESLPLEQTYSYSVQLSVPLFTGFLVRQQVAEARANLDSARYAVTDFRRQVRLRIEQTSLSMRAASEQIEARRKERDASGENLRLATGRYEVGAGDIIEMIDAQVQMTNSDTNLIGALYDYSVTIAALLREIGR